MLNSDWCNIHIFNNWTNSCCLYGCMHKWSLYLTTPCMQSCWSHFRRILEVKQRYVGQPSLPISTVHKCCLWTVSTGRDYSVNSIWTWREHRFRSACEVLYHCLILLQGTAFHWWLFPWCIGLGYAAELLRPSEVCCNNAFITEGLYNFRLPRLRCNIHPSGDTALWVSKLQKRMGVNIFKWFSDFRGL